MDGPTLNQVHLLLRWIKEGPPGMVPLEHEGRGLGSLQACTWEDAGNPHLLHLLAQWHDTAFRRFPQAPTVTAQSVRAWLVELVLPPPDRLLWFIKDLTGQPVGHVGVSRLDPVAGTGQLTDLVAADSGAQRLVDLGVVALGEWTQQNLGVRLTAASPATRRAA